VYTTAEISMCIKVNGSDAVLARPQGSAAHYPGQ
jgi:hypothetical protein